MLGLKSNKARALLDFLSHNEWAFELAVFRNVALRILHFLVLLAFVVPGRVGLDDF